ncbi:eamA-like transporter family protein, partial [Vibrio parahaemolyticus AQ3810]|jgi:hypothetical protein
MGSQ